MRFICIAMLGALFASSANSAEFMNVPIAPEEKSDTYNRKDWKHWTDADNNRVRTRDEVLISESLVPVTKERNKVKSGLWVGPYT